MCIAPSKLLAGIAAGVLISANAALAIDQGLDENCMGPIDIIIAQTGPSYAQNPSGAVSLEVIEDVYGEETRRQAEVWASSGHNFFQSLYWRCIGHRRQWSLDGHERPVSRQWDNDGHEYGWTTDGHGTSLSGGWNEDGHTYQWSRDGHSTNVSQNWADIGHPYATTRNQTGNRPPRPNGSGSWYDFTFPAGE